MRWDEIGYDVIWITCLTMCSLEHTLQTKIRGASELLIKHKEAKINKIGDFVLKLSSDTHVDTDLVVVVVIQSNLYFQL